jgi:glutaminyl-tRNA synthetase
VPFEARLYDYLFNKERPMEISKRPDGCAGDFTDNLNPNSLEVIANAWGEPAIAKAAPEEVFQFERLGYFIRDPDSDTRGQPVFNKTVGLRDTWGKIAKKQ